MRRIIQLATAVSLLSFSPLIAQEQPQTFDRRNTQSVKTGAIIGGFVGAAVVGVALLVHCADENTDCTSSDDAKVSTEVAIGAFVLGGAAAGALLGAVVGYAIGEVKEPRLERFRVNIVPQRDGRLGFGLSVRF